MDPDFHRGDGVGPHPTRHSGVGPPPCHSAPAPSFRRKPESTSPQIHTSHSQFQTPPPALRDSASTPRRRSTTELAEAGKGRGPRFSSGRRGRAPPPTRHSGVGPPPSRHSAPPVIPANAGIHVPPNPHFALPIPNSAPPALRDSASTPRRRSTTELAEARKGRGPRFSSGRRGSPPDPSFRRKPESTSPQIHTSHSQFQTPSPQPSGTAPRLPDDGQPLS